jgi:protein TonB
MSAVLAPQGALLSFPGLGTPRRALKPSGHSRRTGLAVVVLLHVIVGWALASGLARKAVEIVRKPVEARLIEEIAPPPPPAPPKVERIKDVPKVQAPPPPAYVPPPEVVTAAPAPVIQAVQSVAPSPAPVAAPPAPPAPPAPEPKPTVVKQEISVACPGYQAVLSQALEEAIERIGLPGTVNTLIKIRGSQVVEVLPQSGPKEYFKYVVAAVKRMRCSAGGADEVQVTLPLIFSR